MIYTDESGPFFCTKKTSKSNCWNGEIELASDVSGFPVDSISGQGMYCIQWYNYVIN